ncbi:hypothetical protein KQI84_02875 [bacterium]|nr:hypothetical protein [bacterium]
MSNIRPPGTTDEELIRLLRGEETRPQGIQLLVTIHGREMAPVLKTTLERRLEVKFTPEQIGYFLSYGAWKAAISVHQFDPARGDLRGWYWRICFHVAVDWLRSDTDRFLQVADDEDKGLYVRGLMKKTSESSEGSKRRVRLLREEIEALAPLQRAIIRADLAAGGKASAVKLAKLLGKSPENIRVSRHKAHRRIRRRLEERWSENEEMEA